MPLPTGRRRAARFLGAGDALLEALGVPTDGNDRAEYEWAVADARGQLGDDAFAAAVAEGRAMPLEEASEYALSVEADQPEATIAQEHLTSAEPMGNLTPRELEIVLLVARGLTNRQVSTELSISERTAGNHVARILKKLGLRSRAQIASWVSER